MKEKDLEDLIIPRTSSEDLTQPMRMIDTRVVNQDGPPEPDVFYELTCARCGEIWVGPVPTLSHCVLCGCPSFIVEVLDPSEPNEMLKEPE